MAELGAGRLALQLTSTSTSVAGLHDVQVRNTAVWTAVRSSGQVLGPQCTLHMLWLEQGWGPVGAGPKVSMHAAAAGRAVLLYP